MLGSILLIVLYVLIAFGFYQGVASRVPGANDFYSRWMGAKLFFEKGLDPYSAQATREIQVGMYGRPARPEEDQVAFAYPLHAVFLALPFIFVPYAAAESLWISLLMILTAGASVALALSFGWRPSPIGLLALLFFVLGFYPVLRGLFLGQYTLVVYAAAAFGLVLLRRGQDFWAGIVLSLATVKPHVSVLILLVILGWGVWHRRGALVVGFVAACALVLGAAMLLLPSWPVEFVAALGRYSDYIRIGPPLQVLAELVLPENAATGLAVAGLQFLLATLVVVWIRNVRADLMEFLPTVQWAVLVTTFAMVRTATTDQTLLLILWLDWFARLERSRRSLWAVILAMPVLVIPWAVFLATLGGNQEAPIATTTVVTITLVAFLFSHFEPFSTLFANVCQFQTLKRAGISRS